MKTKTKSDITETKMLKLINKAESIANKAIISANSNLDSIQKLEEKIKIYKST